MRDQWEEAGTDAVLDLVRVLHAAAEKTAVLGQEEAVALMDATMVQWVDAASVTRPSDGPLLRFVTRLTLAPRTMEANHLALPLRDHFDDDKIHDIVHIVANFSYMNRLAAGLGVVVEPHKYDLAMQLFSADALKAHLAWGAAP